MKKPTTPKIHPATPGRPRKPRPDFPLFPHQNGYWAKKVRGKLHYFGKWADDPRGNAALDVWLEERDDLLAGRTPRAASGDMTVDEAVNRFLAAKERQVESRDIIRRTFDDYQAVAALVKKELGENRLVLDLRSEDFETLRASAAKRLNPVSLGAWVGKVRSIFRYAYEADLIERPVKFGPHFKAPSQKTLRAAREAGGERLFTAAEIHALLAAAPKVNLRAMILLGINCGFGNHDCAALPFGALNLETRWLDFPRPKNSVKRRCPLWPETVEALRAVIAKRKTPAPEHRHLVFVGQRNNPYVNDHHTGSITDKFTTFAKKVKVYRPCPLCLHQA